MTRVNFPCAMFKAVYSPLVKTLERKVYSWLAKAFSFTTKLGDPRSQM